MIRHIVLFKFRDGVEKPQKDSLAQALKALTEKIDYIREMEVGFDVAGKHNSYDLGLNSTFDSLEDVERYAVHPDHIKVVDMVRELCASSVKVDFEV